MCNNCDAEIPLLEQNAVFGKIQKAKEKEVKDTYNKLQMCYKCKYLTVGCPGEQRLAKANFHYQQPSFKLMKNVF